jgi:hypothetical protein
MKNLLNGLEYNKSSATDSANAVGLILDTVSLTTSGAKLLSVRNNGVEFLSVDKNGNTVINEQGDPAGDFRVESDTEANMVFLDASTDTLYLGGMTNGIAIAKGEALTFAGTSTVWDDFIPTNVIQLSGGAAPNITLVGSSSVLRAQEFPNSSVNEEYNATWQFKHQWKEGSSIVPHLHLYVPDDGTGGNIQFTCTYTWDNIGATSSPETTVTGTLTRAANAGISSNIILSFGSISGSGKTISSIFRAHIKRVQAGGDTFSGTCWLLQGDIHGEIDSIGSKTELSK